MSTPAGGDPSLTGPQDVLVDARGVLCPVPIIRLARAARALSAGGTVTLLSDDPAAAHDVPAWCRLRGHELAGTEEVDPASNRLAAALAAVRRTSGAVPPEVLGGPSVPEPVDSGDRAAARTEPHAPNPRPGPVLIHVVRVSPGQPPDHRTAGPGEPSGAAPVAPHGSAEVA